MFFSSDKTLERTLVVHLDDDAYHFSVLLLGDTPTFEWYERRQFKTHDAAHGIEREIVARTLREVSVRFPHLSSIAGVVGAPHAFVQARHLSKKFEKPVVLTEQIFNDLLATDREHIEANILRPHGGALEVISRLLAHVRVNGYSTRSLFGKTGESVEFDMVIGYIQSEVYHSLDALFAEFFPHAKTAFYARPALYAQAFLLGKVDSALLLDLRAETTHVSLFQKSFLVENGVSMVGVRSLYETTLRVLGASHAEFASIVALSARGDLGDAESSRLAHALSRARSTWLARLEHDLAFLRDEYHIPRKLFVLMPESAKPLIGALFTTAEFRKAIRSDGDFEVIELANSFSPRLTSPSLNVPYSELYLLDGLLEVMHSGEKQS